MILYMVQFDRKFFPPTLRRNEGVELVLNYRSTPSLELQEEKTMMPSEKASYAHQTDAHQECF